MAEDKAGAQPLKNPRWEKYCQKRIEGLSQRKAYLQAYPSSHRWKVETVDSKAANLEKRDKVQARLTYMQEKSAQKAILTRADLITIAANTLQTAQDHIINEKFGTIDSAAMNGITRLTQTMLQELPEEMREQEEKSYTWDFGCLLAPPHLAVHRRIAKDDGGDFIMFGGRSSAKSTTIALEIAAGLMKHKDRSAYITMARQVGMRESVFEKMKWALNHLGVLEMWSLRTSPLSMTRKDTGQSIIFRGCDKAAKSKGAEAPLGTYFAYQWFEECDQLRGLAEIRTVKQSLTRNAPDNAPFFTFYSFNPPRSKDSWANKWLDDRRAENKPIYKSSYQDMPDEWIPQQFKLDALALKEKNPDAYRHEYLGEPVGFGNTIFENAIVREISLEERQAIEYHFYGIDWGFSQDPFCFVKLGYDAKKRVLYILDEFSGQGLTNSDSASEVLARLQDGLVVDGMIIEDSEPYAEVMCDSAEPKSIADYRSLGIKATGAPKQGAHNIKNSIKWLQQREAIIIDPRCKIASKEFPSYSYELTKDGEVTGLIPDLDNHAIDATRYACSRLIANRDYI